jgi:menaquinone-dependent protoporphyrinogen oxidase
MNVLIVYATIEGHSHKIAEWIAGHVRAGGSKAEVMDASALQGKHDFAGQDGVIIIAPVHQRTYPDAMLGFIAAHGLALNANPSAFISVSLASAADDGRAEAKSYVDQLLQSTGWQPTATHLAAGAFRYDEYDYFHEQIIRHIVDRGRGLADVRGDHEFTDWTAIDSFVDAFVTTPKR